MNDFFSKVFELEQTQESFCIVTLLSGRGHITQDPGAKILVSSKGLEAGTVGGGKIEAHALEQAKKFLRTSKAPETHTWNLQRDLGLSYGGEVTFLFESFAANPWNIIIFGAGHIAQALVRTALPLSCQITCVDSRAEWASKLPLAPNLKSVCDPMPSSLVEKFSSNSFFIVMTQGHATDIPILKQIFIHHPNAPFIGVIGNNSKAQKIKKDLMENGISENHVKKLRCPLGLQIGSNHVYEVAISIVAELLQVRDEIKRPKTDSKVNLNQVPLPIGNF